MLRDNLFYKNQYQGQIFLTNASLQEVVIARKAFSADEAMTTALMGLSMVVCQRTGYFYF